MDNLLPNPVLQGPKLVSADGNLQLLLRRRPHLETPVEVWPVEPTSLGPLTAAGAVERIIVIISILLLLPNHGIAVIGLVSESIVD